MAEKKFSQLTAKAATIADTDLVAISESAGGGSYTSKSVTGANIKALVTDANLTTTDVTTNNVSTSKHGFAPKSPNDGTRFLDGLGAYDTVKDSDLSLSDVTDNNVSTTKHGFVPKLPNNTTTFLRGDGTFATPASGGLTQFVEAETTAAPNATVPVDSLSASGAATNIDVAIVPKGTGAILRQIPDSTATSGNKRGANAVDLQSLRTAATQVASGTGSVTLGYANVASQTYSVAIGSTSTASGTQGIALGFTATASGNESAAIVGGTASNQYAFSVGNASLASGIGAIAMGPNTTASGTGSLALNRYTTADGTYSSAFGNATHTFGIITRAVFGHFHTVLGDCQKSNLALSVRTTNATATTLTVGGGAASTNNQVILSDQSAYRFKGTIIGKQSGSTNAASWDVDGLIVRGANAASTTLAVSTVTLVQNTPAWGTPTLAADTTNGGLRVQCIGAASTNIQWTAVIETTEVIYA